MTQPTFTFCPVAYALAQNARNLALMRFPGWDEAIANATADLVNTMLRK